MQLWDHQREAIERAKSLDYFALFFDPGIGKTLTAIKIIEDKFEKEGRYLRTLVLTPTVVVETWKREFNKYSSIRKNQVIPLTGSTSDRRLLYIQNQWPCVFITNYEGLVYSQPFFNALLENPPDIIILDESHKIKDPKAKRTKRCLKLGALAKYRYILTGTAVLNSAMDLYTQISFLDNHKTFGKSFWIFRAQYFDDKSRARAGTANYFPDWKIRPGMAEVISNRIAPLCARKKKEDALDLPDLIRQVQYVELTDEQKRCYKEMKKDLISFFKDKACTASIALVKSLRLQQIVSGFLRFEDDSITSFEDNPRIDALRDLLVEITPNHKVIIWAVFKENYASIKKLLEELKIKYAEIHGEISDKDAQVQSFNTDPSVRCMLAHPLAGGIGISLIPASYSIWYSRNFSYEQDAQATARNYRGGSEMHQKIVRIDLVAKGTIDELILEAVKEKAECSEELLSMGSEELFNRVKDSLTRETNE